MSKNIKLLKSKIVPILKHSNVRKVGIFGSYVRGEQNKNSDIDILVEVSDSFNVILSDPTGLLDDFFWRDFYGD